MRSMSMLFWGSLALLSALWLAADPGVIQADGFFALRGFLVQYSGAAAIACMSLAMFLATRPRMADTRLGGLEKGYRLHKWLGIAALVFALTHWLWAQGAKWIVQFGLLERPHRGSRPIPDGMFEQLAASLRGPAEGLGEWAFYATAILILAALVPRLPYRAFAKIHRLFPIVYLILVFHTLVLTKPDYWTSPFGIVLAGLIALGTWSAGVSLLGRIAVGRKTPGRISTLRHHPAMSVTEITIKAPDWPGHRAGQFAFLTTEPEEGGHPYTIASAWDPDDPKLVFLLTSSPT